MTHWIVENMLYTTQHLRQVSVYSAGTRMSRDNGKSWVVAGAVHVSKHDSFSTRHRHVTLMEYMRRARLAPRTLTVVHPGSTQP